MILCVASLCLLHGFSSRCKTFDSFFPFRAPPRAALEVVSSALPPPSEDRRALVLRRLMFCDKKLDLCLSSIQALVSKSSGWEASFRDVKDWLFGQRMALDLTPESLQASEILRARRGLSSQLASGPLPTQSADKKQKVDALGQDERRQTFLLEEEIGRKFNAIFDNICLNEVPTCEGWYRASQCLSMRAEIIADRLGQSLGYTRVRNFTVRSRRQSNEDSIAIEDLKEIQTKEKDDSMKIHIGILGSDLSVFVDKPWSSYSSLRQCAERVKRGVEDQKDLTTPQRDTAIAVLHDMESRLNQGDYLGWQEAWGGIYVTTLRHLSLRFLSVALYIARLKLRKEQRNDNVISEICEAMGVALYSQLMASQKYGWRMGVISASEKRRLAESARDCFGAAIKAVEDHSTERDDAEDRATYDLLFMIGKVSRCAFSRPRRISLHRHSVQRFATKVQ